jgi:hypothetical protein
MNQLAHLKHTHNTSTTLVPPRSPPGQHNGCPSSEVRLARGIDAPSCEVRLARGLSTPSGGVCFARGRPHACSYPRVRAFNALTPQDAHHDSNTPGNHAPVLFCQLPRGNPSPPLCSTVRQGRCQLRDTVPPTPVRLTRRTLEGGPVAPSNVFSVLT